MSDIKELTEKYIRQVDGKWCVFSEAGKSLGCYPQKAQAVERLRQIEGHKSDSVEVEKYIKFASIEVEKRLVYGIVMVPRVTRTSIPELTLQQFSHLEAVRSITVRPPSLYVDLDGGLWQAAAPGEQYRLLEEIGRIAGEAGYSGASARTAAGGIVGQWLKNTGVRLTRRPAAAEGT